MHCHRNPVILLALVSNFENLSGSAFDAMDLGGFALGAAFADLRAIGRSYAASALARVTRRTPERFWARTV